MTTQAQAQAAEFGARWGCRPHDGPAIPFVAEHADWPTLHLDDVSGIPFLCDILGVERYQLRSRVRARTGDLYAASVPAMPDYEVYCRDALGLGSATFVGAAPMGNPLYVARACAQGATLEALVDAARRAGRLAIHPYMGIEAVWDLADAVARGAGVPVSVLAPPPTVTWFANDKQAVTDLARVAAGVEFVVPTRVGSSPEALAAALRAAADETPTVALKMTRCASAMGNRRIPSAGVQAMDDSVLLTLVREFLAQKDWVEGDDVLVVHWLDTDLSPSSQLWIPPVGEPVCEGLYEQLLEGEECMFLGSIPARFGAELGDQITQASLAMARVYQALGYVGRCSFDFIVGPDGQARFVECNGRWGGTSTPMHLMDRVFPDGRPPYRAQDVVAPRFADASFTQLLDAVGDEAYDRRTGRGRYILYNVGCLVEHGKFDVIAIGDDVDDACRALDALVERLS